ncbi:hypothetical protein AGOR_G00110810 [Albula goreensis]|uniref:Centrosomal protein kizuna n=1 Tax=Albula goreensis TaxID=1534307 RepID=A0A8T3DG63_9TELE|nr:hypothetical protein AGOR_G00110810 [Albula goreensis]
MAVSDKEYFEKIGKLHENLRESEKKRFELERELFAFCKSDQRGSQIKNAKLRCYLKEICEREKRAKTRNLELLRHMERIELQMQALCLNHSALLQKQEKVSQGPTASNSSSRLAKGLYHPATIFMGRQTSTVLPMESQDTRVTSVHQTATKLENHYPCSAEGPESGALNDCRLSMKGTNTPPHLLGDVLADSDFPACRKTSEGDAGNVGGIGLASSFAAMAIGPHRGLTPLSACENSKASKGEVAPATGLVHEGVRPLPSENDPGGVSDGVVEGEDERVLQGSSPSCASGKQCRDAGDSQSCSLPSSSMEKSIDPTLSSDSELPLSLSNETDQAGLPKDTSHPRTHGMRTGEPRGPADRGDMATGPGHCSANESEEPMASEECVVGKPQHGHALLPSEAAVQRLSLEGFSHLLQSIEERLHERGKKVYRISSISEQHLSHLISCCNRKADLKDEDLEACGAAALHQLQTLSRSTSKGCLLPRETISAYQAAGGGLNRSCLCADGAKLWECWLKHAVMLQERAIFTADGIAQLFAPLLVEKGAFYVDEAKEVLRALLEEAAGGTFSDDSDESSGGLPSLLLDDGEIKAARPIGWRDTSAHEKQGQQSGEEDSQEESFVESIPIRETKAYQLLKQSATQHRPQSSQEDEDEDGLGVFPAGIAHDRHKDNTGTDETTRTSSSSFQDGPLNGIAKVAKSTVTAVYSKAFWGESDDSNSEIEAALRPQSRVTTTDEFDDFYD